jgi:hypothetical protein
MKKFSKKGALLFASIMALAAFAMPAAANAATWSPNPASLSGSTTAAGLTLTGSTVLGNGNVTCSSSFSGTGVGSGGSISAISFTGCSGTGIAANCTIVSTAVPASLPWGVTVNSTTSLTIGLPGGTPGTISANIAFTGGSCALNGNTLNASGAVTGVWTNGSPDSTYTLTNAGPLALKIGGTTVGSALMDGTYNVTGGTLV